MRCPLGRACAGGGPAETTSARAGERGAKVSDAATRARTTSAGRATYLGSARSLALRSLVRGVTMAAIDVKVVVLSAVLALTASAGVFRLTSPAFRSGGAIPERFTCDGADVSPPLRWTAPPARARTLALQVVDVSTPSRFVHWLAWGISPRSRGLAAGARPPRQGTNEFGRIGWGGPCPPSGEKHRYVFVLYALGKPVRLRNGATAGRFRRAVGYAGIVSQTHLVGTYRRP